MTASAPQSPSQRDGKSYFDLSPERPSPSKLLRIHQLYMDRATSLPPRRLSSPAKKGLQIRPRLNQHYTLDHAVSLFKSSNNVIVLSGAGISTSLGVPDFRSSNGVYNLLVDSIYEDPQELFHIDNFKTNPQEFYKQAAKVFPKMQGLAPAEQNGAEKSSTSPTETPPSVPKFSLTHAFIALLQAKGKLLTNYTQNIDSLELAAGVSPSKLIQCHGTLATASCMSCGKRKTARKYMPAVQAGNVPYCKCSADDGGPKPKQSKQRGRSGKKKRKRDEFEDTDSEESGSKADFPKGLLKPDMTFFGEDIADSYAPRLRADKDQVDLLVIVGTSLKVEPVNEMLLNIPATVPQIWISKDRCQRDGVKVDIELLGECDLVLEEIARRAGWEDALRYRSWAPGKSFEAQSSTARASEPAQDKARPQQLSGNTSQSKPERPLQIRQRSNEISNTMVKSTTEIVIKVNDEVVVPPSATYPDLQLSDFAAETKQKPEEHICNRTTSSKDGTSVSDVKHKNGIQHEDKNQPVKRRMKSSSPTKVTVELELGTRSRWLIRKVR